MNIFQMVLTTIRGLALVVNNPALGGGSSVRMDEASALLNLFGELLERGEEGFEELEEFAGLIKSMANEGRAPTPTEWQGLRDRSDAAHDVIQRARREAEREEELEKEEREAEESNQKFAAEVAVLEAIAPEELTDEQRARLELLTSPTPPEG